MLFPIFPRAGFIILVYPYGMINSIFLKHLRLYDLVILGSGIFIFLTLIAMFTFPGGTQLNPAARGYSFFHNFFSELGYLRTRSGEANPVSALLFFIGLLSAGSGLVLFSLIFPALFRSSIIGRVAGFLGSIFGLLSGICFIGVAFTPADVFKDWHIFFVLWAFRLFPVGVFFFAIAIFSEPGYPNKYACLLIGFGVWLVTYIWLLENGPSPSTPGGLLIQVTGQKIIGYASILSVLLQAEGAKRYIRTIIS
jgi:hypothetical protein